VAQSDRVQKLRTLLQQNPDDPFLLYALAMEQRAADAPQALKLLHRVIQLDPDQCYAYYQLGQTQEAAGDATAARAAYREGLAAADRVGDEHAKQEIVAALEGIGPG
jgi:predicted TPR repeat methyltransferase